MTLDNEQRLTIQHTIIESINVLVERCDPRDAEHTLRRVRDHLEARVAQCWPDDDASDLL